MISNFDVVFVTKTKVVPLRFSQIYDFSNQIWEIQFWGKTLGTALVLVKNTTQIWVLEGKIIFCSISIQITCVKLKY